MKNLNKILLVVAMISILGSSYSCLAQSDAKYTVLAPLPCIESAETTYIDSQGQSRTNPGITCKVNGAVATEVDFKTYVQYTMNLLIALSAVVAVVMLVWGGIEYMFTSSFSSKKSGLERAQNALVGLLLVLTSYIILRTVDPRLVEIPNTLVPQLTIREELREDAKDLLRNKLSVEMNEYMDRQKKIIEELKRIEEAKKLKDAQVEAAQAKVDELLKKNSNPATNIDIVPAIGDLNREEAEQKRLESNAIIKRSEISFNQILTEAGSEIANPSFNTVRSVTLFQAQKKYVELEYNKAITSMQAIKSSDIDPITNQMLYTKSMLDFHSLDMVIKRSTTGFSKGTIVMTRLDGSVKAVSQEETREYIASEISRIKSSASIMSKEGELLVKQIEEKTSLLLPAFDKKFKK